MSIFEKIKDKVLNKRETNPVHEEFKFAVSQKPKEDVQKYNPLPMPEDLMKKNDYENFNPPNFESMEMPINPRTKAQEKTHQYDIGYVIEQLDVIRAQNEMILRRIKNLERMMNEK